LASRKLIPALYHLDRKKRLPEGTRIVGVSRTEFSDAQWRENLAETTATFAGKDFGTDTWRRFAESIFYQPGDIGRSDDFRALAERLKTLEQGAADQTRLYYLSTAPEFYEPAITHLGKAGMAVEDGGKRRVIIEKPFGVDRATARQLNDVLHRVFREEQVYRIDHYLGKETVQNVLVLRFANTIFEPVWNRNYIDHVQITVAEEVLVGRRGAYYDAAGVMRDMFQNHLLQLLTIAAMEAPVRYRADAVRDEKVKVLQAIRPLSNEKVDRSTIRGQYRGYLDEPGVAPLSQTATFGALRLEIDNWRWQGVPFYLRSGKGMSCRTTQIVIQFRQPPTMLFQSGSELHCEANRLVVQVQPNEGIQLHFQSKVPDAGMKLRLTDLDFRFAREFKEEIPEAYERLLLDALAGDASLFARADEVEHAWAIIDPVIAAWQGRNQPPLCVYEPELWGPEESTRWMRQQGREWFDTCPVIS
jgi:glucose-6-phosphate 1-dehydrogenase